MRHGAVLGIRDLRKAQIPFRGVCQEVGEVVCTFRAAWHSGTQDGNIQETDLFVNLGFKILKETCTRRIGFESLCR